MKNVLLKLLVPLVKHLLAPVCRSALADRHTDRQTQTTMKRTYVAKPPCHMYMLQDRSVHFKHEFLKLTEILVTHAAQSSIVSGVTHFNILLKSGSTKDLSSIT